MTVFSASGDVASVPVPHAAARDREEGRSFAPKFDAAGLITCVLTDMRTS
jgi:hypothetical protein